MRKLYLILFLFLSPSIFAQWNAYCPNGFTNGAVVQLATHKGSIYATGLFDRLCSNQVNYLSRLDAAGNWQSVGLGLPGAGHAITEINNALFFATYNFGSRINFIYRWNGSTLSILGDTLFYDGPLNNSSRSANVYDIIDYKGTIVAAGEFHRVGADTVNGIIQWDGQHWQPLGKGLSGSLVAAYNFRFPHQLLVWDDDLYVVGNFTHAGDSLVNGVARWDGQTWHPVGAGFDETVFCLGVYQDTLYAGGQFNSSGGQTTRIIAKWDGTSWVEPGFGLTLVGGAPFVHTLEVYEDKLFVLGAFNEATTPQGDQEVHNILAFDGQQIDDLDGGRPGTNLEAIIPYDGGYLIGGYQGPVGTLHVYKPIPAGQAAPQKALHCSPNPATTYTYLPVDQAIEWVSMVNSRGQSIAVDWEPGSNKVSWPTLPDGIYFLQWSANGNSFQQSISILSSTP